MKLKTTIIILAIFLALSGCIEQPVCGNGLCDEIENSTTCPTDCGKEPEGNMETYNEGEVIKGLISTTAIGTMHGGETFTLKEGESETLDDGTNVSVIALYGGSATVNAGDEPLVCTLDLTDLDVEIELTNLPANDGSSTGETFTLRIGGIYPTDSGTNILINSSSGGECNITEEADGSVTTNLDFSDLEFELTVGAEVEWAYNEREIKFVQIVQTGPATDYEATFELYNESGELMETQTVNDGRYLNRLFQDLETMVYLKTIGVGSTTGTGYVEVIR